MKPLTSIKLRGRRKRKLAEALRATQQSDSRAPPRPDSLLVVCISDTHNKRPDLPMGDILIHAGDLTENGSFDEVQSGLDWLSSQPHRHKVLIAGNHDVLLDDAFLEKYPERRYGETRTKESLNWGSVIYLQDTCITLDFPLRERVLGSKDASVCLQSTESEVRTLTIFGSPWTPQYGISAFQYRPNDDSHWASRFACLDRNPDIVITHGPPKHHLDARDIYRAGCPYLGEEIARVRPRLAVFGHIHASYGREDVVLDSLQREYEDVMTGWSGWRGVCWMAVLVLWAKLRRLFCIRGVQGERVTTFVNAVVVGGPENEVRNDPIVVEL
ncbi:hypothetical protein ACJ41O_005316 [Fusarium nematophilum]